MEPIEINGQTVSDVVVNGESAGDVTVNGDSVFSAIPDSGSLQAHYDASEIDANDGDSISTWPDSAGTFDATGGSPIYRENQVNGQPAVDFDGVDDDLDTGITPDTTAQQSVYVVLSMAETDGFAYDSVSTDGTTNRFYAASTGSDFWRLGHGDMSQDSSREPITNEWKITAVTYNDGSGARYNNGDELVSGTGSGVGEVLSVYIGGRNIDGSADDHMDVTIAEILHYQADHDDETRGEVESYLNDKYSVY